MKTINSKKLLPSGQDKKQVFLVPVNSIIPSKPKLLSGIKPETKDDDSKKSSIISEKISDVTKLLRYGLLLRERDKRRKRREQERKKRDERERELETKKLGKKGEQEKQAVKIPGSSIFDRLMRFAGFTLLGFLFNNFGKLLPQLNVIGSVLKPAAVGIMYFAEGLLSNTVDWIEKGYKAYDAVSEFTKEIGGENFQKLFNDFSGALTLAINGVIIAGAAALRGGLFKRTGGASASSGTAGVDAARRRVKERREINKLRKELTLMGDLQRRSKDKKTVDFIKEQLENERRRERVKALKKRIRGSYLADSQSAVDAVMKNPDYQKLLGGSGTSGTATATRPSRPIGTGTGGSSKIYSNLDDLDSLTNEQLAALGEDYNKRKAPDLDDLNADLAKNDADTGMAKDAIDRRRQRGFKLEGLLGEPPPVSKPPKPGRIGSRGFGRILPRALLKTTGKKALAKIAGKIPIIGPLVDFVISVILGDRPDKAAAGAVGAAIGAAVGTFIPIPFVGTILGGIAGDIIGRSLYDVVLKMTGMSAEKFNKGGMVGPPPPLPKVKKEKEPEPDLFKDSLGTIKGKEIYGSGDKEEYEKVFGIIKGTYDNILNTSGGFISSLMAGAIGLLSGNDFDENLLRYVGDRYGISAVNGMRDLSNRAKDILNRESSNIIGKKKDSDNAGQGKNQWWDFLDLFPNSKSDSRGSGSEGGSGGGTPKYTASDGSLKGKIRSLESGGDYGSTFKRYLGGFSRKDEDITKMTINQVVQYQKDYIAHQKSIGIKPEHRSAAVGAYQMLYPEVAAKKVGVDLNAKFDQETQDKLAEYYLNMAGQQKFLAGDITAEQYNDRLAGQFASIKTVSGGGVYDDDGVNTAYGSVLDEIKRTKAKPTKLKLEPQKKSDIKEIAMTPAYNSIELHTVLVQPVMVS